MISKRNVFRVIFPQVSRAFLLLGAEAEFVRVFSSVFVDSVLEEAQSKIQGLSVKKYFGVIQGASDKCCWFVDVFKRFSFINNDDAHSSPSPNATSTERLLAGGGSGQTAGSSSRPHAFLKAAAPGLNLVADGIGRAVLEHLGKTMNNIFIPTGVLDVFAENYVAYSNFTRQIEGLLSSSDEQAYWKAEVAEKWQRKWQINVKKLHAIFFRADRLGFACDFLPTFLF